MDRSATVDERPTPANDTETLEESVAAEVSKEPSLLPTGPELFINRELSWLEFNQRVLDEARDPSVPLLERLKFLAICAANLDEFFMVRVAGLLGQRSERVDEVPADGMSAKEQLERIAKRARPMFADIADTLKYQLLPALSEAHVKLVRPENLRPGEQQWLQTFFREQVVPVLTPLAIDPGHPFPRVKNKSLNLIAMLTGSHRHDVEPAFAVVQVPSVMPRLVRVPVENPSRLAAFVLLDDVIARHIGELFPGFRCIGAWPFRVIRNFDLSVDEEEAEDLLESVQEEVRRRDRGNAVRLTVDARCAPPAVEMLRRALEVDAQFVFPFDAPLSVPDLVGLGEPLAERRDLVDPSFTPQVLPPLRGAGDVFEVIAREDVLLHHPYDSFDPVVHFVEQAAVDPDVLAIKQTLYRTSRGSPIVTALARAAEHGKQVTALVEIKARFDEEKNIEWARQLEESGVHVVYGLLGLKTHAKVTLVVRREDGKLRRYVHMGTGNYNPATARVYTDLSFFTARPELGEDASALFNLLTSCTAPPTWRKITVAPLGLHERILGLIERETSFARAGRSARIIAKMNALVDPDVINALYRASQAGVSIDLIVRGICCLRPGIRGVSENIRVTSVVDRFLEHARIFFFEAGGVREVYASSADWMPRNFHRRVEVMFPIENERLKKRVVDEILGIQLEDDAKASRLLADGSYERVQRAAATPLRSQERFLSLAKIAAEQADARERRERPFVVRPVRNQPTNKPQLVEVGREPPAPRPPSTTPSGRDDGRT